MQYATMNSLENDDVLDLTDIESTDYIIDDTPRPEFVKAKIGRPKKIIQEVKEKEIKKRGRPKKAEGEEKFEDNRKEYNRKYYLRNNYLVECSCCKIAIPKINMNKHLKAIYHIENYNNSIKGILK